MRRTFALLQAAWLALLIAEPASLHACAMHATGHGSHAVAAASAEEERPSAPDHHHQHHASHAESAVAVDHETAAAAQPETEQGAASHCQCLGECCAATVTTLSATVSLAEARVVTVAVYAPAARARIAARAVDLVLPFANAPPVALTA